jgi:hypothetical protein
MSTVDNFIGAHSIWNRPPGGRLEAALDRGENADQAQPGGGKQELRPWI